MADFDGDGFDDRDPSAPGFGGGGGRDLADHAGGDDRKPGRKLGFSDEKLGDQRRIFTPAELAATAARRDLLRLLAAQGTGATILRSSPGQVSGASIFGGGQAARVPPTAPEAEAEGIGKFNFMTGTLDPKLAGGGLREFGRAFSRRSTGV